MTDAPRDPRIDAYIEQAAPFAHPILMHLRALLHDAVPGLGETMKWSMPFFTLNNVNFANMAAFKRHAAFDFWRANDLGLDPVRRGEAMGNFGRLTSLADLPGDDALRAMMAQAVAVHRSGLPRRKSSAAKT